MDSIQKSDKKKQSLGGSPKKEGSKKKSNKKSHGGKRKQEGEEGVEDRAEKVGIGELSEISKTESFTRPTFLAWASSQQEARTLLDQAVMIEEGRRMAQEFDFEDIHGGSILGTARASLDEGK